MLRGLVATIRQKIHRLILLQQQYKDACDPQRDFVLSVIKPIIGSVKASKILGTPVKIRAMSGSIPNPVTKKKAKMLNEAGSKLSTKVPVP